MAERETRGEDALIQATFAPLASGFPGAFGLKDDCALLTPPAGMDLVLTTDAVAEGVHFFADDAAHDIAWKALAVNVSDLVAKGARPLAYLLALSFPDRPDDAWLAGFQAGLADAQAAFGLSLAGGDTDRRPGPLSIGVTAVGAVPHGRFVQRGTAQPGDLLFLSGTLGDAALGLLLRQDRARAAQMGLDDVSARALVGRYLRPQPKLSLAPAILEFASAAMDVSDGLVKDCGRLARASGVSARIEGVRVPLSEPARTAVEHSPDLFQVVLSGGDDYEVLAAVPPDRADAFRDAAAKSGVAVAEVGQCGDGQDVTVAGRDGRALDVAGGGWDHFPS
ncbi:thiamine-monophosphate kinase [Hyphomicrobium nitrativorans NL23]|uniref:Thiamine-monophosphate kinase n=1 Tax=Hyphomicrobium nitrativorans NL23 TaxID=1029756 RepID=V5SDI4_9HYPH|nr:thiamine-phosphate kinase [Hyphomicrobium nitrativorans]AHB48552.1 thiamine-monophosphate kinase [Hyphomicrobium nitrativorans NL23]